MNNKLILILSLISLFIIFFIFLLNLLLKKKIKKENFKNNKIKLAIHTIFILKENLPFLREWIAYHINLGFDKIYLYDNTGSIGADGSDKTKNKYIILITIK